jgi:predicted transcriptional regulator
MKTLLTTFEYRVREWLLDRLHNQWRALGVPFSVDEQPLRAKEAIDPEALFWCSLEFFPTQPRLREQVLTWWANNSASLLLPRIRKFAQVQGDPRASIWRVLDPEWRRSPKPPAEPCYGQKSVQELLDFCDDLGKQVPKRRVQRQQPGKAEETVATVILRARHAVGNDAKHFILVYLLANRGGAKLRSVAQWSGHSYQNIAKVAQRWEAANILTLEHGYARLKNPVLWATALDLGHVSIVLLNWLRFYDACINLLRSLSNADAKGLPAEGPVVTGLIREAADEAAASVEVEPTTPSETVQDFTELVSGLH